MLPSSHRLRRKEVTEVLKRGRGLPGGEYVSAKVFYPRTRENGTIRSTAVVSKKVARTNVARNRIRRALYDSVRLVIAKRKIENEKPAHIMFFVRSAPQKGLKNAFTADVKKILNSLAARNR